MRWAAGLVAVAVLILVAGLTYSRFIRPSQTAPVNIASLAVLPLDNPSNDPAQEYFADGMTEELINFLAPHVVHRLRSAEDSLETPRR